MSDDRSLALFLKTLPGVDQVGAEARAVELGTRSIKKESKA
ncbi:MAG: deoxyribose-phosphate aldolase, partial [Actinobacteria bacterium]|nr:deoxyribose-phosphate aldolase [Actinomycetota bacterium]